MLKTDIKKYIMPLAPLSTGLKPRGCIKENIRCILFDIYGTLFISGSGDIGILKSKSCRLKKLNALLVRFDIAKKPEKLFNDFFNSIENQHRIQRKKGIDYPEVVIEQIWSEVLENKRPDFIEQFAVEFEMIVNPVYPMPNLEKVLSECRKAGILLGIISNAQFYTPYLFNWFLGAGPGDLGFDPDLTILSFKLGYAKPSEFLFKMAAKRLKKKGLSPNSALYIGNDMLNDIYPAQKTGFQTGLFAGDARSLRLRKNDPECTNLLPDLVITDLIQVLDTIRND